MSENRSTASALGVGMGTTLDPELGGVRHRSACVTQSHRWVGTFHEWLGSQVDPFTRLVDENPHVGWKMHGRGGSKKLGNEINTEVQSYTFLML